MPIVSEWVGLRPARDRVRLETETVHVGHKIVKVKFLCEDENTCRIHSQILGGFATGTCSLIPIKELLLKFFFS